ncbi:hypothetical protein [Rhodococcoides fascians]|nr:hypothetical protein [Rhodococcus fascians]
MADENTYRTKPEHVQALRWTGDNVNEANAPRTVQAPTPSSNCSSPSST